MKDLIRDLKMSYLNEETGEPFELGNFKELVHGSRPQTGLGGRPGPAGSIFRQPFFKADDTKEEQTAPTPNES